MMITPASVFPSSTDRLRAGIPVEPKPGAGIVADIWASKLRSDPGINWLRLLGETAELMSGRSVAGQSPAGVVRSAFSLAGVSEAMSGLINAKFFDGYSSVPDSCDGWVTETKIDNFLPAHALGVFEQTRLEAVDRTPAAHGYFGLIHENWALARYARQLILSETDLLQSPSVDLSMLAARALGVAAARLPLDLIFGLLMRNVVMSYDSKTFFHVDHDNLATGAGSALSDTSLDAAMGAIANQSSPDGTEDGVRIPCGTIGKFLIVSPALLGPARRLARLLLLNGQDNNLVVRPEPRLTLGVLDPQTEELISGSTTSWLLCSPSTIAPSIIIGGLNGPPRPQLRQFDLAGPTFAGQWGIGFDIVYDVGVVALDPRGIYWSDGS